MPLLNRCGGAGTPIIYTGEYSRYKSGSTASVSLNVGVPLSENDIFMIFADSSFSPGTVITAEEMQVDSTGTYLYRLSPNDRKALIFRRTFVDDTSDHLHYSKISYLVDVDVTYSGSTVIISNVESLPSTVNYDGIIVPFFTDDLYVKYRWILIKGEKK